MPRDQTHLSVAVGHVRIEAEHVFGEIAEAFGVGLEGIRRVDL